MRVIYTRLFPAAWAAWVMYWYLAARDGKPAQQTQSFGSRLSHYVPLVLAVLLLAWPRFGGPVLSRQMLPRSLLMFWTGVLLLFAGLVFSVAARRQLGGNWSSAVTVKQDHSLTRSGPYRLVRHPIYSGILLAIAGNVVAHGDWRDLIALASVTIAFLRKIQIEERFMRAQFGEVYERYRKEVPALIPGLL